MFYLFGIEYQQVGLGSDEWGCSKYTFEIKVPHLVATFDSHESARVYADEASKQAYYAFSLLEGYSNYEIREVPHNPGGNILSFLE